MAESVARALLLLVVIALVVNVAGVGGQGAARTPAEAWTRVKTWSAAKLVGG